MKQVNIKFNTISQIQNFVNDMSRFLSDVDLTSGKYVVNAKSVIGVFSLDLAHPIGLTAEGEDEDAVIAAVKDLIVD